MYSYSYYYYQVVERLRARADIAGRVVTDLDAVETALAAKVDVRTLPMNPRVAMEVAIAAAGAGHGKEQWLRQKYHQNMRDDQTLFAAAIYCGAIDKRKRSRGLRLKVSHYRCKKPEPALDGQTTAQAFLPSALGESRWRRSQKEKEKRFECVLMRT